MFNGVVIEIYTAIIEEARPAIPALEGVADRLADFGLCAELGAASFAEPVQVVYDRATTAFPNGAMPVSRWAAHLSHRLISAQPQVALGEFEDGEEVVVQLVVAGVDTTTVFEFSQ